MMGSTNKDNLKLMFFLITLIYTEVTTVMAQSNINPVENLYLFDHLQPISVFSQNFDPMSSAPLGFIDIGNRNIKLPMPDTNALLSNVQNLNPLIQANSNPINQTNNISSQPSQNSPNPSNPSIQQLPSSTIQYLTSSLIPNQTDSPIINKFNWYPAFITNPNLPIPTSVSNLQPSSVSNLQPMTFQNQYITNNAGLYSPPISMMNDFPGFPYLQNIPGQQQVPAPISIPNQQQNLQNINFPSPTSAFFPNPANLYSPSTPGCTPAGSYPNNNICLKKGCIQRANLILQSMNTNINPCDDFFEYACGNFNRDHAVPQDQGSFNHFSEQQDTLQINLRNVLEKAANSTYLPSIYVYNAYQACLNESKINSLKGKPIIDLLKKVINGWPLLLGKEWNENNFDAIAVQVTMRIYGSSPLILSYVGPDVKNNTQNILSFDHANPGFLKEYLLLPQYKAQLQSYVRYATSIITLLNNKTLSAEQNKEVADLLNFDIQLANITRATRGADLNLLYNKITIQQLVQKYLGKIDFKRYIDLIFNSTLKDSDQVIINDFLYFDKLGELLQKTPKRVLANYLSWRFTQGFVSYLSEEFIAVQQTFINEVNGKASVVERWRKCVDFANQNFPSITGKLYVDTYFNNDTQNVALSLIADIRAAYNSILQTVDWMDISTRNYALFKLSQTIDKIGFPEFYNNLTKIEKIYKGLNVSKNDHFKNVEDLLLFSSREAINLLNQTNNRKSWPVGAAVINAYNDILRNSVVFPAGILQPPFFDAEVPRSVNYGSIGSIIGHELTHGFDTQGKQFNADGNLFNFWSNFSNNEFQKRANCIQYQYGNYTDPEVNIPLNSALTVTEDIADNGGLREAYIAFKRSQERLGANDQLLPGLNFTQDQLFFLSFGNVYCGIYRKEELAISILSDTHSPLRFRINGPISNLPEFLGAFNCPKDAKIANKNPCRVW